MNMILTLALAMAVGLVLTRLVKKVGLPNVTAYLIAGVLIGPYVLGALLPDIFLSVRDVQSFSIITDVALGFIAFSIGTSFKLNSLKSIGKSVLVITITESLGALAITMLALFVAHLFIPSIPLPVVITLGAIATATAPAATLMVVRQYKAHGPVTDTLLPVVALDDATALMSFAICFPIAETMATSGAQLTIVNALLIPLGEILASLAVGAAIGFVLTICCRYFKSHANRLCLMIVAALVGVGLSSLKINIAGTSANLSSLLTCMSIGAIFVNARQDGDKIMTEGIDKWTVPLFMLFFVLSGASLDLSVFNFSAAGVTVMIVAGVYIIFRMIGKWSGAAIGAQLTHANPNVKKYLGWSLFPQAGVAIGLSTLASQGFAGTDYGATILAVCLTGTLIYELTGPIFTKMALTKAGEIIPERKEPLAAGEQGA